MASSRRLTAIMFTDVVGFTASAQADERAALSRLEEQERLVRPAIAAFGGREVKSTGDGFLVEFPSVLKAVECAREIQERLHQRNARSRSNPLELRIGVHLGDVEDRDGDIFGDAVNVAARLVPIAEPGGVCLSEEAAIQVRHKGPFDLERLGPRGLKGLREPVVLYRLRLPWEATAASAVPDGPPRLAVLPLTNISPDPNDEYFADGLTEELIAVLSRLRGLRVIARTSVMGYKGSSKTVTQIGGELGVAAVLEGSVRKAGDRIRVTLQLIDVASQEHRWAESFDRRVTDVFAIQSEVAENTSRAIELEVGGEDRARLGRQPTTSRDAYEAYLRAISHGNRMTAEGFRTAADLLEHAIRLDPNFGTAKAYLANLLILASGDWLPHREAFARAEVLVREALRLDPDSSDAHTASANLALQRDHDWARAEREFETALRLNPSNTFAHTAYASLLSTLRQYGRAEAELQAAIDLDPNDVRPRKWLVELTVHRGDLDRALEIARTQLRDDPDPYLTSISLGLALALAGRQDEARRTLATLGRATSPYHQFGRAALLAALGDPTEARHLLDARPTGPAQTYVGSDVYVMLFVLLGETTRALDLLEQSVPAGESGLWFRYQADVLRPLRHEPRFRELLRQLNLPPFE